MAMLGMSGLPEFVRKAVEGPGGPAEQAEARGLQRSVAALQAQRRRRTMIRQQQQTEARQVAAAQAGGTAGGSGLAGAVGAARTELMTGIGEDIGAVKTAQRISTIQENIEARRREEEERKAKGSIFGQVVGGAAGFLMGGPAGAATGAKAGGAIMSIFG